MKMNAAKYMVYVELNQHYDCANNGLTNSSCMVVSKLGSTPSTDFCIHEKREYFRSYNICK